MKTRIAIAMLMLFTVFNVSAQSGKPGKGEVRKTDSFHHVNIAGEMKVKLIQSDVPMVVVEGSTYQKGNTVTMLKSDTLFVTQSNVRPGDRKVLVTIYADDIRYLEVKGKTTVDATEFNKKFAGVRTTGGAQVKLKVMACDDSKIQNATPYDIAACYAKWTPVKNESPFEQ